MNHTLRRVVVWWAAGMLLATSSVLAAAPAGIDQYRITATKKTAASRKGPSQNLPNLKARIDEDEVYYRFEFQRATPDAPTCIRVVYMIVVQGAFGQLRPGLVKEEEVSLEGVAPGVVETEPVALHRIEWNPSGAGSGALRERVYGWAVRIKDDAGRILLEKFQPRDIETKFEKMLEESRRADTAGPKPWGGRFPNPRPPVDERPRRR